MGEKQKEGAGLSRPPLSSIASVEDSESILCLVTANGTHFEFYQFDPNPSVPTPTEWETGVFAPSLLKFSDKTFPYNFRSVPLSSDQIFIVGGQDSISVVLAVPSSNVSVIDTADNCIHPGIRTLGGKFTPHLTMVGGKIYALGQSSLFAGIDPWAEVFDPISNKWDGLPYPRDDVIHGCVYTGGEFPAFYPKKSRIIISYDEGRLCYYDINSKSWGYYDNDADSDGDDSRSADDYGITFQGRPVVVDDTLYVFDIAQRRLFAYDLECEHNNKGFFPVEGLEEATQGIDPTYPQNGNGPGFLFHLPNGKLCLVWTEDLTDDFARRTRIHCLKFQVHKAETGELVANAENCHCYFIGDAMYMLDCYFMKPTSDSDTTSDNADVSGVQLRLRSQDDSLQGTRHLRRLFVDGFSPMPHAQEIEEFFNTNIKGQNSSVSIVNIYINEEKNFAIVEMNSEEKAREALKLDGSSFQKSTLKIRRPSDYTYWMDRTHSSGTEKGLHSDKKKAKRKAGGRNGKEDKHRKKRKMNGIKGRNRKQRKIHMPVGSEDKTKKKRKISSSSSKKKKTNGLHKKTKSD